MNKRYIILGVMIAATMASSVASAMLGSYGYTAAAHRLRQVVSGLTVGIVVFAPLLALWTVAASRTRRLDEPDPRGGSRSV
jgi:Na+/melibiose symporter-like transporter